MLPLPLTLSTFLALVAVLTSKLQYAGTQFLLALCSIQGVLETIGFGIVMMNYFAWSESQSMLRLLFLTSSCFMVALNIVGFAILTPYLLSDRRCLRWVVQPKNGGCRCNLISFHVLGVLALFCSFKLRLLMFSRLFGFNCFRCPLDSTDKFKVFNLLSFLTLIPQMLFLYCTISICSVLPTNSPMLLVLIDSIIATGISVILSIAVTRKKDDFFREQIGGVVVNQVFNLEEESFQSAAVMHGDERISKPFPLEDISEYDEFAYTSTKRQRNQNNHHFQIQTDENTGSSESVQQEGRNVGKGRSIKSQKQQGEQQQNQNSSEAEEDEAPQNRDGGQIIKREEIRNHDKIDKHQENFNQVERNIFDNARDIIQEDIEKAYEKQAVMKREESSSEQQEDNIPQTIEEIYEQSMNTIQIEQIDQINQIILPSKAISLPVNKTIKQQNSPLSKSSSPPKSTRINLAEYLLSHSQTEHPSAINVPRQQNQIFVIENQEIIISNRSNSDVSHIREQTPQLLTQQTGCKIDKIASNEFHLLINQTQLVDSQPSRPNTANQSHKHKQQLLNQAEAKLVVSRVISRHHSPKKTIKANSPQLIVHSPLKNDLSINGDHSERPITNRSKSKGKLKEYSHPITVNHQPHPLASLHSLNKSQGSSDDEATEKPKRKELKRINTSPEEKQNTLEQRNRSAAKEQNHEEQTIFQSEGNFSKQFTRSQAKPIAIFPRQLTHFLQEEATPDRPPRQPSRANFSIPSQTRSSIAIKRRTENRRSSLDTSPLSNEGRKRMLSLQKIYMQRIKKT